MSASGEKKIKIGITGDASGGIPIKKALEEIAVAHQKAAAADQKRERQEAKSALSAVKYASDLAKQEAILGKSVATATASANAIKRQEAATLSAAAAQVRAQNAMKAADIQAQQLILSQQKLLEAQNRTAAATEKTNSILGKFGQLVGTYFGASTIKSILDTGLAAEALRYRMSAAIGEFGDAGKAMAYARAESERLGLNFKDTAGAFAGFAASALRAGLSMEDVKTIFTGTSEAIRALKLDQDAANRVFMALSQMASKGKISMEELRQQLGEALPGALEIFAKGLGVTPAKMFKMVEAGELTTESLVKMGEAFHEEFGVAAADAADSAIAATNRFQNALFDIQDEIINTTGINEAYKDSMSGLTKFLDLASEHMDILRFAVATLRATFEVLTTFIGTTLALAFNFMKDEINGILSLFNLVKEASNSAFGTNYQPSELLQRDSYKNILIAADEAGKEIMPRALTRLDAPVESVLRLSQGRVDSPGKPKGKEETEAERKRKEQEAKRAAAEAKKLQGEITQAIKGTRTETEKLQDEIANLERLKGFAKNKDDVDKLNAGIMQTRRELDALKTKIEVNSPLAKEFASFAKAVDGAMSESFETLFKEGGDGFRGMLKSWGTSFRSMLAELAYSALAKPIIVSVLASAGGSLGLSGSALSSILGTGSSSLISSAFNSGAGSSSGGGLGNIGSLISNGWSALSNGLSTPIFSAGSMVGSGINSIGASLGLTNANFMGPMLPGTSSLASAFTPMAGIAGFGGNMLGNLIFGGNRGIGASIGGAVGGVAGTAVGASMGTILGMAGGPVGALAGAFLGNALGGLFGGGGMQRVTISSNNTVTDGRYKNAAVSNKNSDNSTAKKFANQINDALNAIADAAEIDYIKRYWTETNIGEKDPKTVFNSKVISKKKGDIDAIVRALLSDGSFYTGGNSQIMGVLQKSVGMKSGANQILQDVNLAKLIYGVDADEGAKALSDALEELNKQFEQMIKRAGELGLPTEKLTELLKEQSDALTGAYNAQKAGFASLEQMTAAFDSFLKSQALGDNSSLTPGGKLAYAQGEFDKLLKMAQEGDLSKTPELLASAQELIDVARMVNASSVTFASLESFVRSSIAEIAKLAGVPGYASGTSSAAAGLAMVGERGPELMRMSGGERVYNTNETAAIMAMSGNIAQEIVKTNNQVVGILKEQKEDNEKLNIQIRRMASEMARVANRLAVTGK